MSFPMMAAAMPYMRVDAKAIGPVAALALQQEGSASLIACFDRSFYLRIETQILCITAASLCDGPLNLRLCLDERAFGRLRNAVTPGQRWSIFGSKMLSANHGDLCIDWSTSTRWQPLIPAFDNVMIGRTIAGIETLKHKLLAKHRSRSFLDLVLDQACQPRCAVELAMLEPLSRMRDLIPASMAGSHQVLASRLASLLGLGHGLTPSGDDMIAGLLIALHHIGHQGMTSALWADLDPLARSQTNPISYAHLSAAGQGLGAAPFHDLINAVINNDEHIDKALDAVAEIGHSSGWDGIGGVTLLLDAWAGSAKSRVAA